MIYKNNKGFSLLELSIAVFIISILFASSITVVSFIQNYFKKIDTKEKLTTIEDALKEYVRIYNRLPCPARLDVDKLDSEFGIEQRDGDDCEIQSGVFQGTVGNHSDHLIYGALPFRGNTFKGLNIYPNYSYDGWGNKFSYVVNRNFVKKEYFKTTKSSDSITINNTNDSEIRTDVIVIVISHGENGKGSYKDPLRNELPDTGDDEYQNIFHANFNKIFLDGLFTNTFDDSLKYFNKYELAIAAGLEEIGCMKEDISDYIFMSTTIEWTVPGHVAYEHTDNTEIQSNTPDPSCPQGNYPNHYFSPNPNSPYNPSKKCLKYGQWSDVMYGCEQGCGTTNLQTVLDGSPAGIDDINTEIDNELWKRVVMGAEATLVCTGGKIGSVIVKCLNTPPDQGNWQYISGNCVDEGNEL